MVADKVMSTWEFVDPDGDDEISSKRRLSDPGELKTSFLAIKLRASYFQPPLLLFEQPRPRQSTQSTTSSLAYRPISVST